MTDRRAFHDERAPRRARSPGNAYQRLLQRYFSHLVPAGQRVLEIGCGLGDLLAAVKPARGVGIDFSPAMVEAARARHPDLLFCEAAGERIRSEERFDYILLADVINDVPDVQALFENLQHSAYQHTRLVLNFQNNLWRPLLAAAEFLGLKAPTLPQNWLSLADVRNLLHLAGWEIVRTESRILWPLRTPLLAPLLNRWLAPLLRHLCLSVFVVARPVPLPVNYRRHTCTVVIPARNEAGNIEAAVRRTPELGAGTEIIFIEGHSKDDTWNEILRVQAAHPDRNIKALRQQSTGKGGAVREAFAAATGDILFILDADLTMPPEELPKFHEVLRRNQADFVNGCRLVYPMQDQAMQFLNMIANKCFGLAFTWLLGQPVKDTLCGTKVLLRSRYEEIAANRAFFGDFDPFGDFDLLFGAARLNQKIVDLPIRYQARTYGTTNIQRWRHGWLLLRMTWFAARRFKFIS